MTFHYKIRAIAGTRAKTRSLLFFKLSRMSSMDCMAL